MATTVPGGRLIPLTSGQLISGQLPLGQRAVAGPCAATGARRPRKISPEAGRGIEMLGHAIEYLADEFTLDSMDRILRAEPGMHPRLQAIELLKARNREIYLSCPEAPTLQERLRGWVCGLKA